MSLTKDVIYSGRTLMAAKSRTFLTMLGVIIGVMSVVAVSSVGVSAQDLVLGQVKAMGTNLIGVIPGASQENEPPPIVMGIVTTTLKYTDYKAVRELPNIVYGSPWVMTLAAVSLGETSFMNSITGSGEEAPLVREYSIAEGRFFDRRDVESYSRVVVLGATVAKDLSPHGSPLGKQIRIKDNSFQVIGILAAKGSSFGPGADKDVFVPVTSAQKFIAGIDHLNAFHVKVDSAWNIDRVTQDIEKTLRRRHHITDPAKDDFSVRSGNQAIAILSNVTNAINAFLVLVTAISLLVGGINIMNIMYVAVRERTREIGLRKALGAKPRRVLIQFLAESSLISFSGGLIGLILGALIALLVSFIAVRYGLVWHFMVSVEAIIIALTVSIGVGLGFGVGPAVAAARLDAIESLRYE